MTPDLDAVRAMMEGDDLAERATGRAAFLRDRGEVKTPDLLEALAAEVEANRVTIANLRQMERNVQAVREFEHQRAEKALATIAGLEARVEALTGALREIAALDVPRPIKDAWREDGSPSKHDLCPHGHYSYEECAYCVADYARAALSQKDTPDAR